MLDLVFFLVTEIVWLEFSDVCVDWGLKAVSRGQLI